MLNTALFANNHTTTTPHHTTHDMINQLIDNLNAQIFNREDVSLSKEYDDGMAAFANKSNAVAIFANMEGELFKVSPWTKNPKKSLVEIADSLYH